MQARRGCVISQNTLTAATWKRNSSFRRVLTRASTHITMAADKCTTGIERGRPFDRAGRAILGASNIVIQEVLQWLAKM
jgi:hypothetical protein